MKTTEERVIVVMAELRPPAMHPQPGMEEDRPEPPPPLMTKIDEVTLEKAKELLEGLKKQSAEFDGMRFGKANGHGSLNSEVLRIAGHLSSSHRKDFGTFLKEHKGWEYHPENEVHYPGIVH